VTSVGVECHEIKKKAETIRETLNPQDNCQRSLTSAGLKGAGVDVALQFFLESVGDSKLTGRNSFRSLEGLAPAVLGVHTTGGASSPAFDSWFFLLLESSVTSVDDFEAGDQTPVQKRRVPLVQVSV
jgi:hypothetical protein